MRFILTYLSLISVGIFGSTMVLFSEQDTIIPLWFQFVLTVVLAILVFMFELTEKEKQETGGKHGH